VLNVRKVVTYELLSLDGVAEKPDGFFADWDDAMDRVLAGQRHRAVRDVHQRGREVCRHLHAARSEVANTTVVDGDLAGFVRDLRNQPGADIGVHASILVAQALLAAGVVDELRLVIAPAIAGSGRRLLDGLSAIRLESIRSTTSPVGYLLVDYRVIG
jgi:dihydrofolate reductase